MVVTLGLGYLLTRVCVVSPLWWVVFVFIMAGLGRKRGDGRTIYVGVCCMTSIATARRNHFFILLNTLCLFLPAAVPPIAPWNSILSSLATSSSHELLRNKCILFQVDGLSQKLQCEDVYGFSS
jgi:hypothetical protein